jgi:acyl carrier protein
MSRSEVMDAVQAIFREQLGDPALDLYPSMETGALEGWDSFANVEILLACEARWGFTLGVAEIDGIRSVGDLVRTIEAKLG